MTPDETLELLAPAITTRGGVWADLGSGDGTFTRALAELLGPASQIYAVDRDQNALAALERWAAASQSKIIPIVGDFSLPFDPPRSALLDGLLFANSLHYIRDAKGVLTRLIAWLKPNGRVVFVEYDRRTSNPWVPYPIPAADLPALTSAAGLSAPSVVGTRPSIYQGELYVAVADRRLSEGRANADQR